MSRKVTTISNRIAKERCLSNMVKNQLKRIKELKTENERLKQHLKYNTKQVRKDVCEEIRQEVKKLIDSKDFKLYNHEYANGYCFGLQYDLAKILDRIQEEPKEVFSKILSIKYQGDKCKE